jgi:PPK2 family polyphosphate:nucleotide phosphotransferase
MAKAAKKAKGKQPASSAEPAMTTGDRRGRSATAKHASRNDLLGPLRVTPGSAFQLRDCKTDYTWEFADEDEADEELQEDVKHLAELQERLYAEDRNALLVIFQALDAAGKDSAIEHVMSGINPQGCQVFSFKQPSQEELDHTYLWRAQKALPERGRIGIFNRSYYEECLVVRVHPEFLEAQRLPTSTLGEGLWEQRFAEINDFERHLTDNGTKVVKIFLNVSKEEQRERFLARIDDPAKNWKFSSKDVEERQHWDAYAHAFEEVLRHTSTSWAPWYVVPADRKWFARLAVAAIIKFALTDLDPRFPVLGKAALRDLQSARKALMAGA